METKLGSSHEPSPERAGAALRRFPWRGLLIAFLLIPLAAYWADDQAVDVILSLMVPPVMLTMAVVILNAGVRIVAPRRALVEGEMVLIYAVLSVATAVGAEWTGNITPLIYSYALFADTSNKFATLILPHVPSFLFFKNASHLQDFKLGGHGFGYFLSHLHYWWTPVIFWTIIIFLLTLAMLCINNLMREEWTQREKLAFPIIQLPIAMTDEGGAGPVWRSQWLWIGFGIFFSIDILNGFHFLYPTVPWINYRFVGDMGAWMPGSPWNSIGWTPIGIFPFVTAIGLFMPTDLLFSLIFFFFFRKFQQIIAGSLGYPQGVFGGGWLVPSPPYFSEQTWGAFLGLFVMAIWVARSYIKELWRKIRTNQSPGQRWALGGLLGSLAGLGIIGQFAGLSGFFVVFYIILFLMFSIALTRMRAELGPPTHEMAFMGPNQLIVDVAGSRGMSPQTVTGIATIFHFANRIHRTDPMPSQLEAMKMGERSKMNPAYIFVAVALAALLGTFCSHLVQIYLGYRWGAPSAGGDTAQVVNDLLTRPREPNAAGDLFMVLGFLMVLGLNFLRFRVASFPLNPVGYALAMNFGVDYYWFGLLIALITKLAIQRYVGMKGYTKLHTFALGVILGEFSAEAVWAIISMVYRIATYSISINGRLGWQV